MTNEAKWQLICLVAIGVGLASMACVDSNASDVDPEASSVQSAFETRLRVKVEQVQRAPLPGGGSVTGTVRAFHSARITAETQGRVVSRVVEPGSELEKGAVLVQLESSRLELEVRRAEAALRAAKTILAHAKREFERGEQLVAESAISAQRRDDLRLALDRAGDELAIAVVARDTAKRNFADSRIEAPFAGTVDSIEVSVGDFVSSGTPVATMVDLTRVRIFAGVTAREAARLRAGSTARVSFADLGGRSFDATLKSVGRVANESDGTYEIELWMDNADTMMRDGFVARVELPNGDAEKFVLAPRAALMRRNGRPEVFVISDEGGRTLARSRILRTGRSDGDWIEVVEGLESGDRVISDGQFALADGSIVDIDESASAPSAAHASAPVAVIGAE